jgi:hypothetical protein
MEKNMFRNSVAAGVLGMAVAAFGLSSAEAQQGRGGMSPGPQNNAPGQQMLNNRTATTSPGNSFNAPGQRMIRERTTPVKRSNTR